MTRTGRQAAQDAIYRFQAVPAPVESTPPLVERYRLTPAGSALLATMRAARELRMVAR
jgi:hypothetical protein